MVNHPVGSNKWLKNHRGCCCEAWKMFIAFHEHNSNLYTRGHTATRDTVFWKVQLCGQVWGEFSFESKRTQRMQVCIGTLGEYLGIPPHYQPIIDKDSLMLMLSESQLQAPAKISEEKVCVQNFDRPSFISLESFENFWFTPLIFQRVLYCCSLKGRGGWCRVTFWNNRLGFRRKQWLKKGGKTTCAIFMFAIKK